VSISHGCRVNLVIPGQESDQAGDWTGSEAAAWSGSEAAPWIE